MEARCVIQVKLLPEQRCLLCRRFVCDVVLGCYLVVILSKYGKQNIKQTESLD
jgi:hypothetical protein